jgi:integrase
MIDKTLLGPWVRRFLLEYLVNDRNLAVNTRTSYRDMLVLLLPFASEYLKKPVERLAVVDLSPGLLREFLNHLELNRHCSTVTRNQRLGGVHALAQFIGENSPEHVAWCAQVRLIPFKKTPQTGITYLEKAEMDTLLAAPDRSTPQGQRDYALLLFLYNAGARASEAAELRIVDIDWHSQSVRITGKGNKQRTCPLWSITLEQLQRAASLPARARATRVYQPKWTAHHPLWHPHPSRAPRKGSCDENAFSWFKTGQSACYSSQYSNPSSTCGCRYQHDPCLAGPRIAQHDKHLCRNRSGDQSTSLGHLRTKYRSNQDKALERSSRPDGVSSLSVAKKYYVASKWLEEVDQQHLGAGRHIFYCAT